MWTSEAAPATCGSITATSHQIRIQANLLLGPVVSDTDGNSEDLSNTVSVFNGPPLTNQSFENADDEARMVDSWNAEQAKAGMLPHELGVFVRSAVEKSGIASEVLDENIETTSGHISISTMHLAKSLEFRAVVVMGCDDKIIPLLERIWAIGDDADILEVYDTGHHLLYVICTRGPTITCLLLVLPPHPSS